MTADRERGATLIEIVVALGVMSIIISVIAASIFVGLKTSRDSATRLTEATGVSFASAYVVPDVASAATVASGTVDGCPVSGTPVVRFDWNDASGAQIAAYATRTVDGAQVLVRRFCVAGSTISETIVVRDLAGPPAVTCSPTPCSTPSTVTMRLGFASGRTVDLSASRRTS